MSLLNKERKSTSGNVFGNFKCTYLSVVKREQQKTLDIRSYYWPHNSSVTVNGFARKGQRLYHLMCMLTIKTNINLPDVLFYININSSKITCTIHPFLFLLFPLLLFSVLVLLFFLSLVIAFLVFVQTCNFDATVDGPRNSPPQLHVSNTSFTSAPGEPLPVLAILLTVEIVPAV